MPDILVRDDEDLGVIRRFRDMGDGTFAEVLMLPGALLTGTPGTAEQRLQVDEGQTGFFERRMFRTYVELNIPTAGPSVQLRFTAPINFILWEQTLQLDQGALRLEVFTGATSTGVWTPLPVIGQNRMTEAPLYNPQCVPETGGNFTGGVPVDLLRIRTAAINNQATNVGDTAASERGLPGTVFHARLSTLAGGLPVNDTAQGTFRIRWEERP